MGDPFVHLRVASGYSMKYGASHPADLVAAAAGHGMDALALTDRDGVAGIVRFAQACQNAGLASIVGADLKLADNAGRVVVLAQSKQGWASLCHLVTAAHAGHDQPVVTPELIGRHSAGLVVLLGDDSPLGKALAAHHEAAAEQVWRHWRDVVELGQLAVAVTHHRRAGRGAGSVGLAGRMLAFADTHRARGVLTHAVRMAHRNQADTLAVLDAARRLTPLGPLPSHPRYAEQYLAATATMTALADEVARAAGRRNAHALLRDTRELGLKSQLDPHADLGLGDIHLPEFTVLGGLGDPWVELRARCEIGLNRRYGVPSLAALNRLDDELAVIAELGFSTYFLTVSHIVERIKAAGIRVAARGSGAGSLVNYALGISGVDPLRYGLIMERFLSPTRATLPDIDIDVESARRLEVYDQVFADFGAERTAAVAMVDTYRVRHAIREVGAALSLAPSDITTLARSFPHLRARHIRQAARDLPELRNLGLPPAQLDTVFSLVESLDGLPRHLALHPCGVIVSDATLADRTPMLTSGQGYAMTPFDKDDVEALGLLKLDILGVRMQSTLAHAVAEIERVSGDVVVLDELAPYDDPTVYAMIGRGETLGCFQIESPGQRDLVKKFQPSCFHDLIVDISLFRPGPVKSDMVTPFLRAHHGYQRPHEIHLDLRPVLADTHGVVIFHEQVIGMFAVLTGCSLADGDSARRKLGTSSGQAEVQQWFTAAAHARGYSDTVIAEAWDVLVSFASFGFCKAHAAAFAVPTYQSAWLKHHHPAAFVAGVLTHDPGMYPKRLLLAEARRIGVPILPLDINISDVVYRVEQTPTSPTELGIRLALADVKGIDEAEQHRIVAGRPYLSLSDFWHRAQVSIDVAERLVIAGAFDNLYHVGSTTAVTHRHALTRRDVLLTLADLDRTTRVHTRRHGRARGLTGSAAAATPSVQLALDFTETISDEPTTARERPTDVVPSGLAELSVEEQLRAELDILGLDASHHALSEYRPFLDALGVTWADRLTDCEHGQEVWVAGVKVATQTPPMRSGRRVIFLSLDDATGVVDLSFFDDTHQHYAATVFHSWLLLGRGRIRRRGAHSVTLQGLGAWDLPTVQQHWRRARHSSGSGEAALVAMHALLKNPLPAAGLHSPSRKLWHSSLGSAGR